MKTFGGFCSGLQGEHGSGFGFSKRRVVRRKSKREAAVGVFSPENRGEEEAAHPAARSGGGARGGRLVAARAVAVVAGRREAWGKKENSNQREGVSREGERE